MNKQRQELAREAETIMLTGGFTQARAEHMGRFWRVCGELADKNEHSGTTFHQLDPQDPRELARSLVALAKPPVAATEPEPDGYESAEAIASEVPTFAPEDDPFGVASLPEEQQSQGHEGDGETLGGIDVPELGQAFAPDEATDGASASDAASEGGEAADQQNGLGAPDIDLIDADFTEDPLLEFGAEVLEEHPEEAPPPQDRFYGLDDLDRRRNLRVGEVVVYCAERIAARVPDRAALRAALAEERNYVMGVETLGWPRSDVRQRELDRLEAISAWIMDTEEHRDTLTGILVKADHAFLEGFVIEDGWP